MLKPIYLNYKKEPACKKCKYYNINKIGQPECKLFLSNYNKNLYEFAFKCREDENLCGLQGKYYKPNDSYVSSEKENSEGAEQTEDIVDNPLKYFTLY